MKSTDPFESIDNAYREVSAGTPMRGVPALGADKAVSPRHKRASTPK
jgi:hypothetical protein